MESDDTVFRRQIDSPEDTMNQTELRALLEKRANAWEEAKALQAEAQDADGWTSERDEKWEKLERDIDGWTKTIDREEKLARVDARHREIDEERDERGGLAEGQYDATFRKFIRGGIGELSREERDVLRGGAAPAELRALGVGTGSAGGFTVPDGFRNKITETLLAFGGVASVAETITTDTGADLPWMSNDDTSNEGAILAEGAAVSQQDVTFGTKSLGAYVYTSKLVLVSYQLLQDTAIDIESFLARKFGMRLARIHNRHQTVGTGVAQPDGIVTGATTGKTTAAAGAITFNEIIDLIHSVDPAYRQASNVQFMFSDGILAYLRKVRDDSGGAGLGRPLWEPSVQIGQPNTIHGYGYTINQHMATTTAGVPTTGTTTVLFGDMRSGYVIRRVRGVTSVRLDEKYAENLQVGFFAFDREDATKDDTNAYKALVQA